MTEQEMQQLRVMMNEVVSEQLEPMRADIAAVKETMATKADLEKTERELRVLIENGPEKVAQLLREDYSRVADAAAQGATAAAGQQELKSQVADHDHALQNHAQRLAELEKKAI